MRAGMLTTGLLACALTASPLAAQQWNIDAVGGRIRSALDPAATASQSIVLGLRYDDALSAFRISGGVPTTSDEPLWGAIAVAKRFAARQNQVMFGVDVAGNGFLLHDRVQRTQQTPGGIFNQPTTVAAPSLSGSAFAGQALPVIGYEGPRAQAYARAGVSYYTGRFGNQSRDRTVRLADAQVTFAPTSQLALIPTVRGYQDSVRTYTYAGVTAVAVHGPASFWGTVGQWINPGGEATPWAAGASLRVHRQASLNASVRRDAIDPLYLTPAQSSWNAGLSIQFGGRALGPAPIPSRYRDGRATLRLPVAKSKTQPSIAGDFNGWKPAPMQRAGDEWIYTVALRPGVYNYSFVNARGEWFVPEKFPGRKDDGMGGQVAVLVVQP